MVENPNYHCTQQQFYEVARFGWENFLENLAAFTAHKGKYDEDYGLDALDEVDAAEALPEDQARTTGSQVARTEVKTIGDTNLGNWQSLKSYIVEVYPDELEQPMLEAAGSKYYSRAANKGWEQMKALLKNGSEFITNNETVLLNGGKNMPATFKAKFNADKKAFEDKYKEFLNKEATSPAGTQTKLGANNAANKKLTAMFADGQHIFRDDPAKKNLFTFDYLLGLITTAGTSGLRFKFVEEITLLPVADVAISIQPFDTNATSNEEGVAPVALLPDHTYNIIVSKPGYKTIKLLDVKVTTGIMSRKNITLEKE